ncbi:MAG: carboxypeptidase regulatory-like domain-containing protein [Myxococcales bacterium]|nr:carboxypeptidase regulatory-like domain-containing protein [Myxococcales bacterium]MCB9718493.1 carboxypeptidase regulatory-like domain-containing protein [Myxococcales bacterium]
MTAQPSLVLASLALLLTACDSGSEPAPAAPTPPAPAKAEVEAALPEADAGAEVADGGAAAGADAAADGGDVQPDAAADGGDAQPDAPSVADVSNAAFFVVRGKGIVALTDAGFSVVPDSQTVYVSGFVHGADGKLYANASSSIMELRSTSMQQVAPLDYDEVGSVAGFDVGPKGEIWTVGTNGVSEYRDGKWTTQSKADVGLGGDFEVGIAVDSGGDPWAATNSSLVHRSGGKWEPASLPKGPTKYLDKMGHGPDGQVYISTYDAIFRLTGEPAKVKVKAARYENPSTFAFSQSTYGVAKGLESASIFMPADQGVLYGKKDLGIGSVSAVAVDDQGRVWAAGDGGIAIAGPGDSRVTWRSGSIEDVAGQISSVVVRGPGPVLPEAGAIKKGGLKGRVIKGGAGVAGVKVELCESPSMIYSRTPCTGAPTHLRGTTDAEGNFVFEGVPLGAYGLAVKSGRKWQITLGAALGSAMTEGEIYDLGSVELQ